MKGNFVTGLNLLLLLTILGSALFFARIRPPASTHDTYWHLAIGRQVWQEKAIPKEDTFVYGPRVKTFTATEWLSGLIFYLTTKHFGFNSLLFLRAILGTITIYFLYRTLKLTTSNNQAAIAATLFAAYILAFYANLDERPGIFSLTFLSIINYLFLHYFYTNKVNRLTFILPLIFLLWPNLHPYSIVGISIFTFWFLIFLSRSISNNKFRGSAPFVITYLLSVIFLAVQHQKVFLFTEASKLTGHITELVGLKERIFPTGQFKSVFGNIDFSIYIYLLLLIFFAAVLILSLWNKTIGKKYLVLALFYLAIMFVPFRFYREIPLAILLCLPLVIFLTKSVFRNYNRYIFIFYLFNVLTFLVIFTSIIVGYPIIGGQKYATRGISQSKAEEFIRFNLQTKRLFTFDEWNNYFIWKNPNIKIFSDVQQEYRETEDLFDQQKLVSPNENPEELLRKYNIDTVVNTHTDTRFGSFTKVDGLSGWQLVYLDDIAIVYARKDIIKALPVDLSVIKPELKTPLRFTPENERLALEQLKKLLQFDPTNGFARIELIIYYLDKNIAMAKVLAEESRMLIPDNPWYSHFLAIIYAKSGNCQQAKQFRDETKSKGSNGAAVVQITNTAIGNCI